MDDNSEPAGHPRLDRKAMDANGLRDELLGVMVFALVVLVNGILAILCIWLAQATGWWELPAAAGAEIK